MFGLKINSQNQFEFYEIKFAPTSTNKVEEAIDKLNEIYLQVPLPSCQRCGDCCGRRIGNPVIFSLEYINMANYIRNDLAQNIRREIYASAILSQARLLNAKKPHRTCESSSLGPYICPCLDNNKNICYIYPVRPLVCRVFGLDSWVKTLASDWQRVGNPRCPHVEISGDNKVEVWDSSIRHKLLQELKTLSGYYFRDEQTDVLFNQEQLLYWFTTQMRKGNGNHGE